MNNLHRELAPISDQAWAGIEEEARNTFKRWIAGRRVVDMPEPAGLEFSSLTTGHLQSIDPPADGVSAAKRQVQSVVELRAPFKVKRSEVDDVERGSTDADWDPVKKAAEKIAKAEDVAVFQGVADAGFEGIAPASSNAPISLPSDVREFPDAVAQAMNALRLVGVAGPYSLLLSADLYTAVAETTDHGYPVRDHLARLVGDGSIIWAPALEGALLVSERGGDYELHLGQDLSIGYLSHDAQEIELYLQETLTFRVNTTEAGVVLNSN